MTAFSSILFIVLTVLVPSGLALLIWPRRNSNGGQFLISWLGATAVWGLLLVGQSMVSDLQGHIFWDNLGVTGLIAVSGLWGIFCLGLTKRSPPTRRNALLVGSAGVTLLALAWTDPVHQMLRPGAFLQDQGGFFTLTLEPGIVYLLYLVLISLLPLWSAVLLVRDSLRGNFADIAPLHWLVLAAAAPFAGLILTVLGVQFMTALGPIALGYGLSGLLFGWTVLQYNLLGFDPIVRETLFENTSSGVLVVGPGNLLAQINPSAYRLLGIEQEDVRGQPLGEALPSSASPLLEKLDSFSDEPFEIEIANQGSSRFLEVRTARLGIREGQDKQMIVLQDITPAKNTELALRNQKRLLEDLVTIARASTRVSDVQTTFQNILSIAAELTGAQVGSLFLLDREGKVINSILARGEVPREIRNPILDQVMESGLAGWTVRNNRPTIIEDTRKDDRWVEVPNHPHPVRSALAIPITSSNGSLGVMTLEHDTPGHFTQDHSTLLQAAADQMALALRNAQVHEEQQQVNRRQVMLYKVLRSVSGHLDPATILDVALSAVHSETVVPAIAVLLPGPGPEELTVQAAVGREAPDIGSIVHMDSSSPGKAYRTGKSQIIADSAADPEINATIPRMASELSVPLMSGQRITGVLTFESDRPGYFDNEDMMLAESIADAISLSLENASLYQEVQHRLEEQTLLRKAAEQISSTPDLFGGLDYLANQMVQTFKLQRVAIFRYEDGARQPSLVAESPDRAPESTETSSPGPDQNTVDMLRSGQIVTHTNGGQLGEADADQLEAVNPDILYSPFIVRDRFIGFAKMHLSELGQKFSEDELALMRAISQQAALALQRVQLFEDIQNARQAAEDADSAKSEFITVLAHELQGPMTSIKGFAEMLSVGSMGPINDSQRNFLQVIQSTVDRMSLLVSELTDISRIESGHLSLKLEDVDPAEVIGEVMAELQGQASQNRQELVSQIAQNLPKVMADPSRLAQILTNLLSNAIKYTPHGGRITISAKPHENSHSYVQITIEDTGIGISAEDQKQIFEKFFRTKDELAREITGTGLGLNITRHLVELQGGKIWFESRLRQGTTFHFTLPAVRKKEG